MTTNVSFYAFSGDRIEANTGASGNAWLFAESKDGKYSASLHIEKAEARQIVDVLTAWLAGKAEQPAASPPLVVTGQGEYEEVHHG